MTRHPHLEELLQAAVELELSTIPPYLCALYSLRPEANEEARLAIRSVVVEEMLHLVLAANVLNAIGGTPVVGGPGHTPRYPHELPSGVVLDLMHFSPDLLQVFLHVENPDYPHEGIPDTDPQVAGRRPQRYPAAATRLAAGSGLATIGAFYEHIIAELTAAAASDPELFDGDPARQITADYYYAGGGRPVTVTDLASALEALREVIDQGEGNAASMYDESGDLAHYYRLEQIALDRAYLRTDVPGSPTGPALGVDWDAVFPMIANPVHADLGPELDAFATRLDEAWTVLLEQVDEGCNGNPAALLPGVHSMFRLRDLALALLANPLPGHPGSNAGPTFVDLRKE